MLNTKQWYIILPFHRKSGWKQLAINFQGQLNVPLYTPKRCKRMHSMTSLFQSQLWYLASQKPMTFKPRVTFPVNEQPISCSQLFRNNSGVVTLIQTIRQKYLLPFPSSRIRLKLRKFLYRVVQSIMEIASQKGVGRQLHSSYWGMSEKDWLKAIENWQRRKRHSGIWKYFTQPTNFIYSL